MDVSENSGTPKSSILIGFSIINHPFWGKHPYFWKHPYGCCFKGPSKAEKSTTPPPRNPHSAQRDAAIASKNRKDEADFAASDCKVRPVECVNQRLFQHTELEHTAKPFTNRLQRDSFHSWLGDCLGCALGVYCNFLAVKQ